MADNKKARAAAARRSQKGKNDQSQYAVWAALFLGSVVLACFVLFLSPPKGPFQIPVNDPNLITHVNRNAKTWHAAKSSFFDGWTIGDVKLLQGAGISNEGSSLPPCTVADVPDLPEHFDSRQRWPHCFTAPAYNMGNCSSSWAIPAASSLSNRYCISDPATFKNFMFAPQQLLSCDGANQGCKGGSIDLAFQYVKKNGLVSEDCFPYQADSSISCRARCGREKMIKSAAPCVVNGEAVIRREIFLNGPVVAPMFLTDDFLVYGGGVYQEMKTATQLTSLDGRRGDRLVHIIKIVGWGTMEGKDYWVIENSWGEDWGEQGFAKVPRGGNPEQREGLVLENYVIAGTPRSRKMDKQAEEPAVDNTNEEL